MNKTLDCPKCNKEMIRGRLYTPKAQISDAKNYFDYVNWEADDEKKFSGLFAYKCEGCGFIEFYVERKARKS
jgi:hypothetical protein